MSDLNPLNGGKKSRIFEEEKKRVLQERKRQIEEEKKRRKRKQKMKQRITLGFLCIFIVGGIALITINVGNLFKEDGDKSVSGDTVKEEESTTASEVISDSLDVHAIQLDEDMYIYENDQDMIQQLKDRLYSSENGDERLEFIIENQAAYPPEMIEFLVKYEEVIDFVLKYPVEINGDHSSVVDISVDYTDGTVPTFIQWDDRWGYIPYGDNVIGDSGCGPTCLAMAVVAITGRGQYTPITISKFAEDNGYYVDGIGTAWDLMLGGVKKLGLKSEQISYSEESLRLALNEGKYIILSMGPGIFTTSGHFILVYKYENGKFYVKDPNSRVRSDTGFAYSEISDQIKAGWAIYNSKDKR